jgi:hypothetical protein
MATSAQDLIELGSVMRSMSDHAEHVHNAPCIALGIAELFVLFVQILHDENILTNDDLDSIVRWIELEAQADAS